MKIVFDKESFHSNKTNKDYYVVFYKLIDKEGNVKAKSKPIMWLTKETYDSLNF